jgi:large subunit ribosomal protein L29
MSFSKISDFQEFESKDLDKDILLMSQQLVELRIKQATRQPFKPHNFKHTKHKLAQLLTLQKKVLNTMTS